VSINGLERVVLWVTAGSFQVSVGGVPLFYLRPSGPAFVFPTVRRWQQFRTFLAMLLAFLILATTTSTAGHPAFSLLKLVAIPLAVAAPWAYLRGLPRTSEPFRKEDAERIRNVVMDRSLVLGLIEIGAGWAAIGGLLASLDFDRVLVGALALCSGLLIDGARRLSKKKLVPPYVH